jgi:phycocyanobilin lyase subunit beta
MSDLFSSALLAVNEADSAQKLIDAVEALSALKDSRAILPLIEVLGFNNPGAAVAAVDGLIQIGIPAVEPLLDKLDGYNYGARAWAIRALAGIGDPRGQGLLLQAASEDFAFSVRRAAARGLGTIDWQAIHASERLTRQLESQLVLLKNLQDDEWVVRYAAIVGLQALTQALYLWSELPQAAIDTNCQALEHSRQTDETLAIRARAQWALQSLPKI